MHSTRIDVPRLIRLFAITVGLPLATGIFIDVTFGTAPTATIVLGFVAIPVASILVLRLTLSEFDRVIAQVAPKLEPDPRNVDVDESWIGTGLFEDDPQDSGRYLVADVAANTVPDSSSEESIVKRQPKTINDSV